MKKETIELGHGRVEVLIDGNLIYLNVFGEYTDDDVFLMLKYLDNFFSQVNGPTVRVWDSRNISREGFKLTSEGTDQFAEWSQRMKQKWPDNVSYMIADSPIKYGVSRMYEIKASVDFANATVVRDVNELPENIRNFVLLA